MAKIEGVLEGYFETGTEGVLWAVQEPEVRGYEGLHCIEAGDELAVFHPDGATAWSGVIVPNRKVGFRPFPLNPAYGQQLSCGYWVHWIQEGFAPDEWGRLFFGHNPPLRATLTRAAVRAPQYMGPQETP